jgi:DNA-directed RNA polymerase specialized sigma24 family protein
MTRDEIATSTFARSLINRKARKLVRKNLFPELGAEDLAQELTTRLLGALAGYDRGRPFEAFVVGVVERAAAELVRHRLAAKRNVKPGSLDAGNRIDGPPDPLAGDRQQEIDLDLDMATAIAALAPELRAAAEALMHSRDVSAAARKRGLARSSFQRHVERLRRELANSGLEVYLE